MFNLFNRLIKYLKPSAGPIAELPLEEQLILRILPELKKYVDDYKLRNCYTNYNLWMNNEHKNSFKAKWHQVNRNEAMCQPFEPPGKVGYLGYKIYSLGFCIEYRYSHTIVQFCCSKIVDSLISINTHTQDSFNTSYLTVVQRLIETEQIEETRTWLSKRMKIELNLWILERIMKVTRLLHDLIKIICEYLDLGQVKGYIELNKEMSV